MLKNDIRDTLDRGVLVAESQDSIRLATDNQGNDRKISKKKILWWSDFTYEIGQMVYFQYV